MSAISCPSQTSLTDSDLTATFGNGTIQGLLPSTPNGSSDRDGNGMLQSKVVSNIVSSLVSAGVVPPTRTENYDQYIANQATLIKNIQAEYCFYEARYKYSLGRLFSAISAGYADNNTQNQTVIQNYLASTQALNQRLNDLSQITNGVTQYMLSATTDLESEIKKFEAMVKDLQGKLQEQNTIISSSEAVTELNKQMVKFTEEKARRSDNLLSLYSFLNIVALGLLVYVYRSSP
jgi:uncharacterized protein YoxC